jgi:hypothetical protein
MHAVQFVCSLARVAGVEIPSMHRPRFCLVGLGNDQRLLQGPVVARAPARDAAWSGQIARTLPVSWTLFAVIAVVALAGLATGDISATNPDLLQDRQ